MNSILDRPFTFDRFIRLVLSLLGFAFAFYLLYLLKDILLPFFIAWLLAYMLNPFVRFFRKRLKLPNPLAVVVTLLSAVGILVLVGTLMAPFIGKEIGQINTLVSNYDLAALRQEGLPPNVAEVINNFVDFKAIQEAMNKDTLLELVQYISPSAETLFSSTISFLLGLTVIFLVVLYLIFILLDYDKINELWHFLIPPKYRAVVGRITVDVEKNMNNYFRHQALICLILSVLYAIGFQLIGLPLAIIFGVIVGLVHMVPYLQVITFLPAILLCWLRASQSHDSFWGMIGLVLLVFFVIQCILDLFLVPRIMGKAMGLNPAIILLSLSIWGSFFGIVGMIIAIPLTTLLLSYYKGFIASAELLEAQKENIPPPDA